MQIPQLNFTPPAGWSDASTKPAGTGFRGVLENVIDQVEQSRANAEQLSNQFTAGGAEELHSVALSTQRAELEFELTLQVRNKVVSAYQEIMRMQV